jgi:hypothetical protein
MCIGTYREITDGAKVISITDISGKTNYRKTTCNQLNLKFKVGKEVVLSGNSRLPFYRGLIGAISHYAMNYPHEFFETKLLTDELKVALMTFVDSNGNIQYPHLFIFDEHTGMMEYEVFYNSNTGFLQKIVSRDGKKIIAVRVTAESVKSGVYNIRFHYSVFNDSIYSYDWYYNVNVRPSNIRFIQCVRRSLSI